MPNVEILTVERADLESSCLRGGSIDAPREGETFDSYSVPVAGWALGPGGPAVALDIVVGGESIRRIPLHDPVQRIPRPDLNDAFPQVPRADAGGLWTKIGLLGMPLDFSFDVHVVTADDVSVRLATVRGRRQPLRTRFQPHLQPLLVTTLGRTGSTWLMRLLMEHPEITTHRAFPYESRGAAYWMHLLKVLSEPANHHQATPPAGFDAARWTIGPNPYNHLAYSWNYPALLPWCETEYPEQLALLCQRSIEQFYLATAIQDGVHDAHFFVEKGLPNHIARLLAELYPDGREIMLVRDPRDMLCSILAFNRKRGIITFGREAAASDADFIRAHLRLAVERLFQHWRGRVGAAYLLRYEDLILHPHRALRELLTYVGVDASSSTVDGMLARTTEESVELREHRTSTTARDSIGRWQRDLSLELQAICAETFADLLPVLGYEDGPATCS